jgi:hypothetical protein
MISYEIDTLPEHPNYRFIQTKRTISYLSEHKKWMFLLVNLDRFVALVSIRRRNTYDIYELEADLCNSEYGVSTWHTKKV